MSNEQLERRPIAGFPAYTIDRDGKVRSCLRFARVGPRGGFYSVRTNAWRPLRATLMKIGYFSVMLRNNGVGKRKYIHSLVLEAFVGPRPEGMQVCHEDGNRQNNALSNLRWGTPTDNADDMRRHGRFAIGAKHGQAKLTDEKVKEMRRLREAGRTCTSLAAEFGVCLAVASKVCRRESWRHVV